MPAAAHPPTQLVQLGDAEAVGVHDDHQGGVRHVHAHLDHRGGHEELDLTVVEAAHDRCLLRRVHTPVQHAGRHGLQLRHLREGAVELHDAGEFLLRRRRLDIRLVQLQRGAVLARPGVVTDLRTHHVHLPAGVDLLPRPRPYPLDPGRMLGEPYLVRADGGPSGGELGQRRDLKIPEHRQAGSCEEEHCGHDQHVG